MYYDGLLPPYGYLRDSVNGAIDKITFKFIRKSHKENTNLLDAGEKHFQILLPPFTHTLNLA